MVVIFGLFFVCFTSLSSNFTYDSQYILYPSELLSTRPGLFFWSEHPRILRLNDSLSLSDAVQPHLPVNILDLPSDFFKPAFNPSLVVLPNQSYLALLRVSNGPGCPHIQNSPFSSEQSRELKNALFLIHLDPGLRILGTVEVQTPAATCEARFHGDAERLERVSGVMDARLYLKNDKLYTIFYCERNVRDFVTRGVALAELEVAFEESSGRLLQAVITNSMHVSPEDDVVEKNWQLVDIIDDVFYIQRGIQPNVIGAFRYEEMSISFHSHGYWQDQVIFGSSNVRGGFCCLFIQKANLYLGVGHMVRHRGGPPGEELFETRVYTQFFYAMDRDMNMVGVSPEFCFGDSSDVACEAIQFASGLVLVGESEILISYGLNDCEAKIARLGVKEVMLFLRPVHNIEQ